MSMAVDVVTRKPKPERERVDAVIRDSHSIPPTPSDTLFSSLTLHPHRRSESREQHRVLYITRIRIIGSIYRAARHQFSWEVLRYKTHDAITTAA